MSKQVISLETGKTYLLERVGELRAQAPHGNPFVFLGAFSVLNALGKLFNSSIYDLLYRFGDYNENEAEVVQSGARFMFEGFTLTAPVYEDRVAYFIEDSERTITGNFPPTERVEKLNLSHKDRQHKARKAKKLTLSANAFLEDVEKTINGAFDSIKDDEVAGAKVFVKLNETPLIGYGE